MKRKAVSILARVGYEETLIATGGVPYDVERVTCRECGEVRQQNKKRLVA